MATFSRYNPTLSPAKMPGGYNVARNTVWFALIITLLQISCSKTETKHNQPPSITGISPTSGDLGTAVTITGTNFGSTISGNTVNFNGVQATITSASATTIIAEVPADATTGLISVITANGTASSTTFTYVPDIILAGGEINAGGKTVAKYWKNGVAVPVTDGANDALAYAMFVAGPDIYLTGYEFNGTVNVAKYWKNGVATSLGNGTLNSGAYSIVVSGTDVYVAGFEASGNHTVARCWKNGVSVPLWTNDYESVAWSVTLSGQDVYLAGSQSASNGGSYAKYWKNGKGYAFGDSSTTSSETYGTSIAVSSQGDIYVAGSTDNYSAPYSAVYWKNGVETVVSGSTSAEVDEIIVVGTHFYMAGHDTGEAEYWLDNTETPLTTTGNAGLAHSVFVYGDDVFAAGSQSNGTFRVGKYWKNGVETAVTDGTANAYIWSIIVR